MNKTLLHTAVLGLLAGALLAGSSWAVLAGDDLPNVATAVAADEGVVTTQSATDRDTVAHPAASGREATATQAASGEDPAAARAALEGSATAARVAGGDDAAVAQTAAGGDAEVAVSDEDAEATKNSAPVDSVGRVQLEASDGQRVLAWLHERAPANEGSDARDDRRAKAPVAVLLHMFLSEHSAWDPLVPELLERGFAVVALDLRGHGENVTGPEGEDLVQRARDRDAALFNAMHLDAAAVVQLMIAEGFTPARIGLVGASVGCSVAIDTAVRSEGLGATCVLTPGQEYLGVPTMEHIKQWGQRQLLIVSSEEERGGGADPIHAVLQAQYEARRAVAAKAGHAADDAETEGDATSAAKQAEHAAGPASELWILPEERIHGTRMFGKVDGIEARLAEWLHAALVPAVEREAKAQPKDASGSTGQ